MYYLVLGKHVLSGEKGSDILFSVTGDVMS